MPAAGRFELESVRNSIDTWKASGKVVVLTNGHFDILHVGHLRYLEAARRLGDALVVAINSDASTRNLKGSKRPIVPEQDRAELVAGLGCVDAVLLFDADTAESVVAELQPDIYVKGGDYSGEDRSAKLLPEARIVVAYGGRVEIVPLVEEQSTSALINRVVDRYRDD